VSASITRYRSSMDDGADDVDGAEVVVVGRNDIEGSDDGVDDHDDVKDSQIGSALSLLDPSTFGLNKTSVEKRMKHPFGYSPLLVPLVYVKRL